MWVFLDNTLVCDIGGVHSSVGEYVDLWDYLKLEGRTETEKHTLTVFYTCLLYTSLLPLPVPPMMAIFCPGRMCMLTSCTAASDAPS